jgi:orotate phosphoribosyltransferase
VDEQQARSRLLELLIEKSFRKGKIILSSGKQSDFYVDCKQTCLSGQGHLLIAKLFHKLIRERFPQARAVGGPTLGADPMISAIATWSVIEDDPLDAFIIRKDAKGHGTGAPIEGMANLAEGCPVVVVEDVITTGGSTLRSVAHCRDAKLNLLGVIALVDRQEGGRAAIEAEGIELITIFTREDFPI